MKNIIHDNNANIKKIMNNTQAISPNGDTIRSIREALFIAVRAYISANNLKLKDIAEKIGCDQSLLSHYEAGDSKISDVQIEKICRAINIRWSDLPFGAEPLRHAESIETMIKKLEQLKGIREEAMEIAVRGVDNAIKDAKRMDALIKKYNKEKRAQRISANNKKAFQAIRSKKNSSDNPNT